MDKQQQFGLITAAGFATRLGLPDASKEVLAVADIASASNGYCPVSHYLLRHYHGAGLQKVLVVTRAEKSDIAETLGHNFQSMPIQYQLCERTPSVVHTIDSAFSALSAANVAFGFPDIIVKADAVYKQLFSQLSSTDACVVLGLFPCMRPEKFDMVVSDDAGRVQSIDIKNAQNLWSETWVCAVWSPVFTHFLHEWVKRHGRGDEVQLGQVIQAAIDASMTVSSVRFPLGQILDIGTPEDLALARQPEELKGFFQVHSIV